MAPIRTRARQLIRRIGTAISFLISTAGSVGFAAGFEPERYGGGVLYNQQHATGGDTVSLWVVVFFLGAVGGIGAVIWLLTHEFETENIFTKLLKIVQYFFITAVLIYTIAIVVIGLFYVIPEIGLWGWVGIAVIIFFVSLSYLNEREKKRKWLENEPERRKFRAKHGYNPDY